MHNTSLVFKTLFDEVGTYGLSVTFGVSLPLKDWMDIPEGYSQAVDAFHERFRCGGGDVFIHSDMVREQPGEDLPYKTIQQLFKELMLGHEEEALGLLMSVMETAKDGSYALFKRVIRVLVVTFEQTMAHSSAELIREFSSRISSDSSFTDPETLSDAVNGWKARL